MRSSPPITLPEAIRTQLRIDSDSDSDETPSPESQPPTENLPSEPSVPTEPEPNLDFTDLFFAADEVDMPVLTTEDDTFHDAFNEIVPGQFQAQRSEPQIVSIRLGPGPQKKILDEMKETLADPNLRAATRHRFIELVNSAIYLDNILFRRNSEFLGVEDTTEGQQIVEGMMRYLGGIEDMLVDLREVAGHVDYMLGLLMDEDETAHIRFRRMKCVVQAQLKKPRRLEQTLLGQYADFFEEWVYTRFVRLRDEQIQTEELACPPRLRLTMYLRGVWGCLSRCIDHYAEYRETLIKIKEQRFEPIMAQMIPLPDDEQWFGDCP
ncbi:hypothetical protein N7492_002764 [Penicillium capsulatum]|uniref:Uncharacterized protein n=1 Tax=Penicillium capsulatum TaxID=69766 RepID=A0A9W9IKN7_9EURO|nr:hypothetical protein N7492_002764 [Penicillium capsulatum]KAJ6122638.1 hypothetical protein N7512_005103 [Penicillium capsulatum]